jgi:hypothetical protein
MPMEVRSLWHVGTAAFMEIWRGSEEGLAFGECVRLPWPNGHRWAPVKAQQRFEADEGKQPGKGANRLDIANESTRAPHR